jgi:lipoate-protein ligase B
MRTAPSIPGGPKRPDPAASSAAAGNLLPRKIVLKSASKWLAFSRQFSKDHSMNPARNGKKTAGKHRFHLLELGRTGYAEALEAQQQMVAARRTGGLDRDVLLVLEHPPIFTLGRRGGRENLLVGEGFLADAGIEIVQVERGGNITYHGPGQLVAYVILDLEVARLSVTDYVDRLEEVMLRTAAGCGVAAGRNPRNRGIWVGAAKLGSIGIAIRRGISFHGLALNVATDLTPFEWINPCGLSHLGVTSLQSEAGRPLSLTETIPVFKRCFAEVFCAELVLAQLLDVMPGWTAGGQG